MFNTVRMIYGVEGVDNDSCLVFVGDAVGDQAFTQLSHDGWLGLLGGDGLNGRGNLVWFFGFYGRFQPIGQGGYGYEVIGHALTNYCVGAAAARC